jgi:DNA-binding transcriptional LysR family regulator
MVCDGRADVALVLGPVEGRGLDSEPLVTEEFMVALPAADPLAARRSLRLADLAGCTLPGGLPAEFGLQLNAHGPVSLEDEGESDLPQIFRRVELGSIVCFFPTSVVSRYTRPETAYRPVVDLAPADLAVVWAQDARSPAVAAFVRTAATVAAEAAAASAKLMSPARIAAIAPPSTS